MKLSTIVLALGVTFSGSAFATGGVWDSATPWTAASQYAEWTDIESINDSTPEDFSAGSTANLTLTNPGRSAGKSGGYSTGTNIYGLGIFADAVGMQFTSTLAGGAAGGFYDVYLRIGTAGTLANTTATLNGVAASNPVQQFLGEPEEIMGGVSAEQELYWKWTNVAGASLYTFTFSAAAPHMSLDQVSLATVAVTAVPEPEAYGMMGLGLGLVALARRRQAKKLA